MEYQEWDEILMIALIMSHTVQHILKWNTNTDNHHKRLDFFDKPSFVVIFIHHIWQQQKCFFLLLFNIVYCKCIIFGSNKFALALENQCLRLFSEKKTRQIKKDLFK